MTRPFAAVLLVVVMAAVIVGVDILFLRDRLWERLVVNILIVCLFAAIYVKFVR